jgi:cytochrome c oxidase assembly protein subunit 15
MAAQPTANEAPHDLMSRSTTVPDIRRRAVRMWLLAVAAMIFALVLVGGATRLTESGLSIVEWKPVTGTLPPLNAGDWEVEFEKYKSIPQYQQLNRGMSLDEFKTIFWWEWTHRLLGRLVGFVFLLPFLCFLWMGWVEPGLRLRLWTIFGLGAAQGAVGWWMVASGLAERVSVSQYRLAFHLTLACLILAATLWTAQRLLPQPAPLPDVGTKRLRASAIGLVVLVLCQIYLGALVAGLRAGLIYNTWPLIEGSFIPDAARLFVQDPWWRNLFENTLTVQFMHRTVAYLLWLAAIIHAVDVARTLKSGQTVVLAAGLAIAVTIQAVLGILTLLHVAPIGLALAHQATAILVLALAVVHAERLSPRTSSMPLGQPLAGAT